MAVTTLMLSSIVATSGDAIVPVSLRCLPESRRNSECDACFHISACKGTARKGVHKGTVGLTFQPQRLRRCGSCSGMYGGQHMCEKLRLRHQQTGADRGHCRRRRVAATRFLQLTGSPVPLRWFARCSRRGLANFVPEMRHRLSPALDQLLGEPSQHSSAREHPRRCRKEVAAIHAEIAVAAFDE